MNNNPDVCEICGEPAVSYVYDTKHFDNYVTGIRQYEIFGKKHTFCQKHDRPSLSTYGGDIYEPGTESELRRAKVKAAEKE
jgi:hypothetical protein